MRVSNTFLLLHHLIVLLPLVFRSLALVIFEESKICSLIRYSAIYAFCDLSYLFVFCFFDRDGRCRARSDFNARISSCFVFSLDPNIAF